MYGKGLINGLIVTMQNLIMPSRQFTIHQYPDRRIGLFGLAKRAKMNILVYLIKEPKMAVKSLIGLATVIDKMPQHSRFRGEEFSWYEQRCTGCASCAKYCPLGIIEIVTDPNGQQMQEGQNYGIEVFDIDIGRCMFCGLCVEACPYDAIHMGSGFEEGKYERDQLVIDLQHLKSAPKRPSTWYRPQLESDQYTPTEGRQASWKDVGRHQMPTDDELEDRWASR